MKKTIISTLIVCIVFSTTAFAENKSFKLSGSIYVGWMPWFLADQDKTLQKNAEKKGISIKFIQADYIESINQFAAGGADAVVVANIDALALLVGGGVASDVILIGDYSHGNDAILLRPGVTRNLIGKVIGLVEFSVSHYLFDRYLEKQNIPFNKVKWLNIADSEMAGAFGSFRSSLHGVVTWNPIVLQIEKTMNGQRIFDSNGIKKEISDLLIVRRTILKKYPEFAQALLKTWFDIMKRLSTNARNKTIHQLGLLSGADGKNYEEQLKTTLLFDTPNKAMKEIKDQKVRIAMEHVETFVQRHKLMLSPPSKPWVSYSNDKKKALLHFNEKPLKDYIK